MLTAWKPGFYPAEVPANQFLKLSERLNCVEINYTFRHMPSAGHARSDWVEADASGFVFAVKAHMRITHILRLKNAGQATDIFYWRSIRCGRRDGWGLCSFSCRPS